MYAEIHSASSTILFAKYSGIIIGLPPYYNESLRPNTFQILELKLRTAEPKSAYLFTLPQPVPKWFRWWWDFALAHHILILPHALCPKKLHLGAEVQKWDELLVLYTTRKVLSATFTVGAPYKRTPISLIRIRKDWHTLSCRIAFCLLLHITQNK